MHPTLQALLMVREKDLLRWGRISAVMMFGVASICFAGAIWGNSMINQLTPKLRKATDQEISFLQRKSEPKDEASVARIRDGRRKADEGMLKIVGGFVWIVSSAGLLALLNGMLYWRAYDLVSTTCVEPGIRAH